MRWYDWDRYPKTSPKAVDGGIRARSKRGAFGQSWWARRWIAVLEGFNLGARLGRGKSYARKGQVISIEVEPGRVEANVQGSRSTPYQVSIAIPPIKAAGWKRVGKRLAESPVHVAKLLAGEMPEDVEVLFDEAGISLFPTRMREIDTDCSCPDWSNPCKHIAAVYYLLGEEFDRDPFLIFRLRGLVREDLVAMLGPVSRSAGADESEELSDREGRGALVAGAAAPEEFWSASRPAVDLFEGIEMRPEGSALLRRLGPFPFWRVELPVVDLLEPTAVQAAERAHALLLGVEDGPRQE